MHIWLVIIGFGFLIMGFALVPITPMALFVGLFGILIGAIGCIGGIKHNADILMDCDRLAREGNYKLPSSARAVMGIAKAMSNKPVETERYYDPLWGWVDGPRPKGW